MLMVGAAVQSKAFFEGDLADAISVQFGSFENMKTQLSAATTAVQGSGWGWLGYNKALHKLQIATCANQDPLEATTGDNGSHVKRETVAWHVAQRFLNGRVFQKLLPVVLERCRDGAVTSIRTMFKN